MSDGFFSRNLMIAGLAGAAFTGYCIYFDYKRRSAPDYKQKIRENRRAKERSFSGSSGHRPPPSPMDPAGMQAFFLQEMQDGEDLMNRGEIEEGAQHVANAVALSGQPQQIVSLLQQAMPQEHFEAVLKELPEAKNRLAFIFHPESAVRADARSESPPVLEEIRDELGDLRMMMDDDELE